jgi:hypothetical protein
LYVEFDTQYLSRVFLHKQNLFEQQTNSLNSLFNNVIWDKQIFSFSTTIFHARIKNKERLIKIVERKIICNQKEICSQEEICNQERICSEEICDEDIICNQVSRIFQITRTREKSIKNDRFVNTKKSIFVLWALSSFFFAKNEFSSTEDQHFWKRK